MNYNEGRRWLMVNPMHQALLDEVWQVRYNNFAGEFEILGENGEWIAWISTGIDGESEIEPMVRAMPELPPGDSWVHLGALPGIAIKGGGIMSGCRNAGELKALRADRQRLTALIAEYESRSNSIEQIRKRTG